MIFGERLTDERCYPFFPVREAVARRCSEKKMFLKISQNSKLKIINVLVLSELASIYVKIKFVCD